MPATISSDFKFTPKVWQDHVDAFFRKKLVFGSMALTDNTLTAAPGETVNFPFFEKIGAAEELLETEGMDVDNLTDDSFSATVKEVGKAVGIKMKALRTSAARRERIFANAQDQMGRVMAEKIDADLITEIDLPANHKDGFVAAAASDKATLKTSAQGRLRGFGDRSNEARVHFLHSLTMETVLTDATEGALKWDATDPMARVEGFIGRALGLAWVMTDNVPRVTGGIGGKQAYRSYYVKENAYGFLTAEEPLIERDKDILNREWIMALTQWYAVKGFHAKIASDDIRVVRNTFASDVDE